MNLRLPIESRAGNLALLAIGWGFLLGASGILVFALVSTWGFAGMIDRALQAVLVFCAAFGMYLVAGARRNLGGAPRTRMRRRTV